MEFRTDAVRPKDISDAEWNTKMDAVNWNQPPIGGCERKEEIRGSKKIIRYSK
jgi:hypothetical protein